MSETLTRPAVPAFETVSELDYGLSQKGTAADIDLYPRDGSRKLYETERRTAHLAGVNPENLILFNSGMTALTSALEVSMEKAGKPDPVIACAQQLYGKAAIHLSRYARRHHLKMVRFDSSDDNEVERAIEAHDPDIIISETVGNGADVPVLNHERLLEIARNRTRQPTLILDHTLPLSSSYSIYDDLVEDDNVVVVESGTKAYTLNRELSGLAYAKNDELIASLRSLRCEQGILSGVGSIDLISSLLPDSKEAFDSRNKRIYENTGRLALKLYEASLQPGADFIVSHPVIPQHDNYEYASSKNGGQISPVFYLQCLATKQACFTRRLAENVNYPEVRQHAELGQSFGFDKARILHEQHAPVVRIAGGAFTDVEELGAALYAAALDR